MSQEEDRHLAKVLSLPDLVLFTVSAIVLLETLGAAAAIGPSALFWWLFFGLIFLFPITLVTAELGSAIPDEGGIYVWIRRAFGKQWAARAVWAYWVNTAIWLPALYVMLTSFVGRLFHTELSLLEQVVIGVTLSWLTVLLDVVGLRIGKWIPNLGAVLKMVIFATLAIGGLFYAYDHGFVNEFTFETVSPEWSQALKYLPVVIYGSLGFELVSGAGGEIRNPRRNISRGIFISAVFVLAMYFFATMGFLAAIPSDKVDIVEGLIDILDMFFASIPGGDAIVFTLGFGAIFTFFSNGATWTMGCNRTAAQAGKEGELPRLFGWTHPRHGGPVGAAVLMGTVSSTALIIYGFVATSNADLFWSLMAFSGVIFLLPFIGMVLSLLKLRRSEPDLDRPFTIPGGKAVLYPICTICVAVLLSGIILFSYVPEEGPQWPVIIGSIVTILIGEVLIILGEANRRRASGR